MVLDEIIRQFLPMVNILICTSATAAGDPAKNTQSPGPYHYFPPISQSDIW